MSTPSRLLALLGLLQLPRPWSGGELAARLEVSRRTIRRDVDRLRSLGYPIEASMGAEGGYRLVAGSAMPPLLLDDEEAVAIAVGLRTSAGNAIAGIDEAAVRALAKLEQVLPARLKGRVAGLGAAVVSLPGTGPAVDPAILILVARAIAGRERLRFVYRRPDGTESRRTAEPNRLVVAGRRWYLVAWDVDRDDWRFFRVDRMHDPWSMRGPTVQRELPDGQDAVTFVRTRQYDLVPTYRMVATLHAPFARLAPRLPDGVGELVALDAGSCRLTAHADTLEWLAFRLIFLGCEFEVHEPPEMVDYLRMLVGILDRSIALANGLGR